MSVLNSGEIILVDGANCLVEKWDIFGSVVGHFGGHSGLGESKLKEPVGAFVCGDLIVVTDWHNHRLVFLDQDLNFQFEYGARGVLPNESLFLRVVKYMRLLFYKGAYIPSHFGTPAVRGTPPKVGGYSFLTGISCIWDLILSPSSMRNVYLSLVSNSRVMYKPNGVCILDDMLLITQKNNRCVSLFRIESRGLLHLGHHSNSIPNKSFGRLGQCFSWQGLFWVCDPENACVWKVDRSGSCVGFFSATELGLVGAEFFPFGGCGIRDGLVALGGKECLFLVDVEKGTCIHHERVGGEIHGLAYCRASDKLFVADRKHGKLKMFAFYLDSKNCAS
ncbi:hypothetical protein LRB11_10070 [Ectothiorhodospira haloalkaliphila]|uniref:hypothetical protein n=1 Tax=Ectothiorhodospira haloalkaliphila TaxID=421628 RepID=UPI001EE96EFB|nr:hypothetical protein [Ectothiorhodospira haloalkaliphila]MCG5525274.1 hypothetical protein [Ectothiorhodospira haloalkaliphila]